ncbi:hypothetical protein [Streptomyces kanamyceticus]|uniref:hypothetical protein n=1 Tax=Streptomyces kanamyceticus TaxID=1967 RepID=UPI0037DD3918
MPPFALLDTAPAREAEKAVAWERHVTEVEFGKPLDADPSALPRLEYDLARHTMEERVAAKAAELQAIGWQASLGTVQRMRRRYRRQGLWGLVDRRATRPPHRRDEPMAGRVVSAIMEILTATTNESTGTRG